MPDELLPYYYIRDELFVWNKFCIGRGDRAVIPRNLHQELLKKTHDKSHMGIVRLKQKLRASVYWRNLDKDAEHFVRDCIPCSSSDKTYQTTNAPLDPRKFPSGPWMELGIDIMGPFQSAPTGFRFLVVMTD